LASATAEQAATALRSLAPADVHVVYSARDLARQVPAEWQEQVKHRKGLSYADFLHDLVAEEPSQDSSRWFWAVQDWPDVLHRWAAALPADHVHLVTVPPPGGPVDQLWERYRELFGIDPASCPEPTNRGKVWIFHVHTPGAPLAEDRFREYTCGATSERAIYLPARSRGGW
jgi:hypothetical protein